MKTINFLLIAFSFICNISFGLQIPKINTSFIGSNTARVGFPYNRIGVSIQNYNSDSSYFGLIQIRTDLDININDILGFIKPDNKIRVIDSISYDNKKQFTFLISNIPPKKNKNIQFEFDLTNNFNSSTSISYGLLILSNTNLELADYLLETTKYYWQGISSSDEIKQIIINSIYLAYNNLNKRWKGDEKPIKMFCEELSSLLNNFLQSKGSSSKISGKFIYSNIESIFDGKTKKINNVVVWNNKEERYTTIGNIFYQSLLIKKRYSFDPNEKTTNLGYGEEHYINKNDFITYRINFENKSSSTAPAYRIVIIDTLSEFLDPNSVQFISTSHKDEKYKWNISQNGRILKWQIDSIELPPNVHPPEGEGYVEFIVKPIDKIPNNTIITNKATITFDLNSPLTTNLVTNRIDLKPPQTKLFYYITENQKFAVIKKLVDEKESGCAITNLYISDNNSSYSYFCSFTNDSIIVNLDSLNNFDIFAISVDYVGNAEEKSNIIRINKLTNYVSDVMPSKIELFQNYPNPFNPITNIKYTISEAGLVQIIVYDILGREVTMIINKYQTPGLYNVVFDGSRFNSGVYYYQIRINNYSIIRKMVLLK